MKRTCYKCGKTKAVYRFSLGTKILRDGKVLRICKSCENVRPKFKQIAGLAKFSPVGMGHTNILSPMNQ